MKEKPCVSMIMPVYNAEAYLEESIRSVMEQSYAEWELLLVDDGSTDHSLRICQAMAGKDARIRVIALEENVGAGYARNEGIRQVAGKYLTFVDADDAVDPTILENAVTLAEHHDLDWVVWGMKEEYYDAKGMKQHERMVLLEDRCYPLVLQARQAIIRIEEKTLFGYQCNKLYRTDILKENQIFFEKFILYEDFFFNAVYARHIRNMGTLAQVGYCYKKRNQKSITATFTREYFSLSKKRVQEMVSLYKEWGGLGKKEVNILGNIYIRYILSALSRNCDPKSRMNKKDRKEWIQSLFRDELYQETSSKCKPQNKVYAILQWCINKKYASIIDVIGCIIYVCQTRFYAFYIKKKAR